MQRISGVLKEASLLRASIIIRLRMFAACAVQVSSVHGLMTWSLATWWTEGPYHCGTTGNPVILITGHGVSSSAGSCSDPSLQINCVSMVKCTCCSTYTLLDRVDAPACVDI